MKRSGLVESGKTTCYFNITVSLEREVRACIAKKGRLGVEVRVLALAGLATVHLKVDWNGAGVNGVR